MTSIQKVRSISVWIFIIPFISVNVCLLIITNFHQFLVPGVPIDPTFPYLDGGVSISRTVRNFPMYLLFKPAMFITSYLLIRYWLNTKNIINNFNKPSQNIFLSKKINASFKFISCFRIKVIFSSLT